MSRNNSLLMLLALAIVLGKLGSSGPSAAPAGKPISSHGPVPLTPDALAALIKSVGLTGQAALTAGALAQLASGGFADMMVDTRGMSQKELLAYWGRPMKPQLKLGLWQIDILDPSVRSLLGLPNSTPDMRETNIYKAALDNAKAMMVLSKNGTDFGYWRVQET
jgi:hypothetical protein